MAKGGGVVFRRIGANHEDAVAIGNIIPVIGHYPTTDAFRQTGDSGGMSETGVVLYIDQTEGSREFDEEVTLLIV